MHDIFRPLVFLAFFTGLCAFPQGAQTAIQLTGKSDLPTAEQVSNPRPSAGDVLLPMPGGLKMTLRPVCVPATGYLDDMQLSLGVPTSSHQDAAVDAYADRRYTTSLNAPFEISDIPSGWGQSVRDWLTQDPASAVTAKNGLRAYIYFIGKYEVTRAQWRAVMEQGAPFAMRADDARPMTGISWFDAQEFTRRYSEWLMKNHPEILPFFRQENRSSFIRLPTETEWEYAARGGHRVNPVERERTRLHPAPENANMSDYIIAAQYDSSLSGLAPVASRKANPLELYDILGNSAEMVQTPFQLVAAGHLVGNQGGFVIKGGSWRAFSEANLHPGRRIEAAYYVNGAAQRRDDLGFRVSLGTILTPKDRRETLQKEWEKCTAPKAAQATAKQDVRIVIREVVREVENPILRQRLAEAEEIASQYHEQVNANEERMMHEMLLGAAFSLETIANYASRCYQLIKLMDAYTLLNSDQAAQHQEKIANMRREINGFVEGIRSALFYYRKMLEESARYDLRQLSPQLEKLSVQFAHDDGFSRSMGRRLKVLQRHVEVARNVISGRTELDDLADILPSWLLDRLKKYWI